MDKAEYIDFNTVMNRLSERFQDILRFSNPDIRLGFSLARSEVFDTPRMVINGKTSDGYHTFDELYHHRAVLFSVIVSQFPRLAWKAKLHADGTMYDGMFIVGLNTPNGQATYHYDLDPYWNMFKCMELERAPEWDGHTPAQAIERIGKLPGLYTRAGLKEEYT